MIAATVRKYRDVFDPADRGEWQLPTAVTQARTILAKVSEALDKVAEPRPVQDVQDEAVQAALASADPADIDLSALLDHRRLREESDTRTAVLRQAQQRADSALATTMRDSCDQIITECLRPSGQATWEEITRATRSLGDLDTSDTNGLLRAGAKTRAAFLELGELTARYHRIREAMERLLLHAGEPPQHDIHGDHGEFRVGLCSILGSNWRAAPMSEKRQLPWPADAKARLVWLVRNGHEPWFATTEQRDEAWLTAHRAEREKMQHQQYRHGVAQRWAVGY